MKVFDKHYNKLWLILERVSVMLMKRKASKISLRLSRVVQRSDFLWREEDCDKREFRYSEKGQEYFFGKHPLRKRGLRGREKNLGG